MRASLRIILIGGLLISPRFCFAQGPATDAAGPCVDLQVGGERVKDLACLNRQLKWGVEHVQEGAPLSPPIDATSPSTTVGTANQAAAEEKMGSAFGKSAVPQRPAPQVFVDPVVRPPGGH